MATPDTPKELTEQMFAAVGRAITQWSFVEYELSTILAECMGTERWKAISVFYSVENWRTKLQMVDAALTAHTSRAVGTRELIEEWARLSDKSGDLAKKRNKLAHWFVLPAQHTGTGASHEPIAPARLCPPYGSPNYYAATGVFRHPTLSLDVKQIRDLEKAFHEHSMKVRAFSQKLQSCEGLRDRHVRQAHDLLQSDGRLGQPLLEEIERILPPED